MIDIVSCLPFAAMLISIAVLPLMPWTKHWFESNSNKAVVSMVLGAPAIGLLFSLKENAWSLLAHTGHDYGGFVLLLAALYTYAGGIRISGNLRATPRTNTLILGIGAVLASLIGTTGASMLLIKLMLDTNKERRHKTHTGLFFIWIVSNCGGLLTPLGDPPLFLGFMNGVPFHWTLTLWPQWLFVNGSLLALYLFIDTLSYRREAVSDVRQDANAAAPIRIEGKINFLFVLLNIGVILLAPSPLRELFMFVLLILSLKYTPSAVRESNRFSWTPMVEVAVIFAGIFATMILPLEFLRTNAAYLPVKTALQYYVVTGSLSSVLDNAPTYLTFLAMAQGQGLASEIVGIPALHLAAISCGSVFMGCGTYIGNGPNLLVRAICDEWDRQLPPGHGYAVAMPGFFGYALYTGVVAGTVFGAVGYVFFS